MSRTLNDRIQIQAHRGASAYAPENTMEAFRLAIDMKADGIELDCYLTKDKKIVVLHDGSLNRCSNGQGHVSEYNYDELLAFDLGYGFYKKELRGIKLPLLSEVYELFSKTNMVVNVEIKERDPAIIPMLDKLADEYSMQDRIIYSSFIHSQLAKMLEQNPRAFVAPLYGNELVNVDKYCEAMGAKAAHCHFSHVYENPTFVDECHAKGIRVHPWTVDNPEDMKRLADAGVDALITNKPDLARQVLGIE